MNDEPDNRAHWRTSLAARWSCIIVLTTTLPMAGCAALPLAVTFQPDSCAAAVSAAEATAGFTARVAALDCQLVALGPVTLANLQQHARIDQAVRAVLSDIQRAQATTPDAMQAREAIARIMAGDVERGRQLLALKPVGRWFSATELDPGGHMAAFLIFQHAGTDTQETVLPDLQQAGRQGLVPGDAVAMLTDRVLVSQNQPQEYGTQGVCQNGQLVLPPVRDPDTVDARRQAMGLTMPLAAYQQAMRDFGMCR
ncbi:MAG: hypothetical protein MUF14_06945 [Hyphomonadaceae bacterium]|jgi:hypothetical protein|nr:hypothetical protein [Hyphomonadaceae bacterium]